LRPRSSWSGSGRDSVSAEIPRNEQVIGSIAISGSKQCVLERLMFDGSVTAETRRGNG